MSATDQPPPPAQLLQMLFGYMVTRSISAVTELNVPDALKDGPRSTADLAQAVGAHEGSLGRVMRTLVSTGLFAEPEPGTYALTPVSDLLRSDAPASMRDMAVMITAKAHWVNSTGRRNISMMRCCDAETETETEKVRPGRAAGDVFAWSAAGRGA